MAYTHIQFIAHCLYTLARLIPEKEYNTGGSVYKEEYVGLYDDRADLQARVDMIFAVMNVAWNATDQNGTTIKIMVFPEAFFHGLRGAYNKSEVKFLKDKLTELSKNNKFKDWLIVFGTVNHYVQPPKPEAAYLKVLSICCKNGDCYTVRKQKYSQDLIDEKSLSTQANWINAYGGPIAFKPKSTPSIFVQDGLTFSIEICADHGENRAKNLLKGAAPFVEVQLVPSAGSVIFERAVSVRNGGYILNCDGWNVPSSLLKGFSGTIEPVAYPPDGNVPQDANALLRWEIKEISESTTPEGGSIPDGRLNVNLIKARRENGSRLWYPHSDLKIFVDHNIESVAPTNIIRLTDNTAPKHKELFAKGPGALHIWDKKVRPK